MRAVFKFVGFLLGLVVVLLLVTALALTLFFDPNDYKDQIVAAVEERTGRDFTIGGDIKLAVFPWLGVQTGQMELANAPGFGPEPLARVREVDVAVKMLPLFKRQIEARTVTLRGLTLNLVRDASGHANWQGLVPEPPAAMEQPAEPRRGAPPAAALATLTVGGIQIEDARVSWDDRVTGERYTLSAVDLRTGAVTPPKPFPLDLNLQFASRQPVLDGHLGLKAIVHVDPGAQRYRLEGVRLQATLKGDQIPQGFELMLDSDIRADLAEDTLQVDGVQLAALGIKISGALAGTQISRAPSYTGTLEVAAFNPKELLRRLGRQPPPTAEPEVLTRASASLGFLARSDSVQFHDLAVALDRSRLTGKLQMRHFAAPRFGFELALDGIDLDAYLPPRSDQAAAPVTPAEATAGAVAQLPVETLRDLNLDGSLSVGKLKITNLRTDEVRVKIQAANGLVQANPIDARLYQGQYAGAVRLDARGETLQTRVQWNLSGVQAGPLLKDLTGQERLLGTGNVQADVTAAGNDAPTLRRTLNGSARFVFTDGAVKGINIAHLIRTAKAAIEGRPAPPQESNQTDFSELSASLRITDGVASNDDLQGKSPLLRVTGEGSVNLPQESVNYTVNAVLVASLEGQGGKALEELKGVTIPIRITGPLAGPRIAPDLERLVADRAKAELEKKTDRLKEKLGKELDKKLGDQIDEGTREKLKDKLPGVLKGLFQ